MKTENPIEVAGGMIQELRHRQKFHSWKEVELAKEIQRQIHVQQVLEDERRAWEIHQDLMRKEDRRIEPRGFFGWSV